MQTVKALTQDFYNEFHCIGPECPNTCCGNWAISIDSNTYEKYKKIAIPELAKKIQTKIASHNKAAIVVLDEHKMCPFLTEGKLCEIQQKMGYDYLSNTCKYYPRLSVVNINSRQETHLSLSCPEVARLALLRKDKQKFIMADIDKNEADIRAAQKVFEGNALYKYANEIRENCIEMMQNEKLPILQRIFSIAHFLQGMEKSVNGISETSIELGLKPEAIIMALSKNSSFAEFIELVKNIMENVVDEKMLRELRLVNAYKYITAQSQAEWEKTIESKALVFENYFVNFMFSEAFPFCFEKLNAFQHAFLLWERYELCHVYLCAYAIKFGEIKPEHISFIASKIEKYFSHEPVQQSIDRILKIYTLPQ